MNRLGGLVLPASMTSSWWNITIVVLNQCWPGVEGGGQETPFLCDMGGGDTHEGFRKQKIIFFPLLLRGALYMISGRCRWVFLFLFFAWNADLFLQFLDSQSVRCVDCDWMIRKLDVISFPFNIGGLISRTSPNGTRGKILRENRLALLHHSTRPTFVLCSPSLAGFDFRFPFVTCCNSSSQDNVLNLCISGSIYLILWRCLACGFLVRRLRVTRSSLCSISATTGFDSAPDNFGIFHSFRWSFTTARTHNCRVLSHFLGQYFIYFPILLAHSWYMLQLMKVRFCNVVAMVNLRHGVSSSAPAVVKYLGLLWLTILFSVNEFSLKLHPSAQMVVFSKRAACFIFPSRLKERDILICIVCLDDNNSEKLASLDL